MAVLAGEGVAVVFGVAGRPVGDIGLVEAAISEGIASDGRSWSMSSWTTGR